MSGGRRVAQHVGLKRAGSLSASLPFGGRLPARPARKAGHVMGSSPAETRGLYALQIVDALKGLVQATDEGRLDAFSDSFEALWNARESFAGTCEGRTIQLEARKRLGQTGFVECCGRRAELCTDIPDLLGAQVWRLITAQPDALVRNRCQPVPKAFEIVRSLGVSITDLNRLRDLIQEENENAKVGGDADTLKKKRKKSTESGEARERLIAALTKHHKYDDGGCLNMEPIGNNELARQAEVDRHTASDFFKAHFEGHAAYKAACVNRERQWKIREQLKVLNGDFTVFRSLNGEPSGEDNRSDDEE
jgi:hypothetical protein